MAQNKKSIWSTIILVCTIVSLVVLVASIIVTAVGLPVAVEAAKQAAIDQGYNPDEAALAASIVMGTVVGVLIFSSILEILKIIGGFLFSLKGRWGIFCIVLAILSVIAGVYSVISDITNKAGGASIAVNIIGLVVSILFTVACFKHYQENKQ